MALILYVASWLALATLLTCVVFAVGERSWEPFRRVSWFGSWAILIGYSLPFLIIGAIFALLWHTAAAGFLYGWYGARRYLHRTLGEEA